MFKHQTCINHKTIVPIKTILEYLTTESPTNFASLHIKADSLKIYTQANAPKKTNNKYLKIEKMSE